MRVLWLNSGGPDSLVAALQLRREWGDDIAYRSLYVDFNPHNRERALAGAETNCDLLDVEDRVVLPASPGEDWWFFNRKNYFTHPYLALYLHTVAAGYALHNGIEHVVSGFRGDASGPKFPGLLQELIVMTGPGNDKDRCPILHFPLAGMEPTVEQTYRLAQEFEVPLAHTWSCNAYPPCGHCRKCAGRDFLGLPQE